MGLGLKVLMGLEDGVAIKIGVEGVLVAVWARVTVVDRCGE